MLRRDFLKRGSLWTLGATILTPELIDRLTWKRTLFPGGLLTPAAPYFELFVASGRVEAMPAERRGSGLAMSWTAHRHETINHVDFVHVVLGDPASRSLVNATPCDLVGGNTFNMQVSLHSH
jgi:hypothetical protein